MLRVPVPVAAGLVIVLLVALASTVVFLVTTRNAEESVDEMSRRVANATMEAVEDRIRDKAFSEPAEQLFAAKTDLELHHASLRMPDDEGFWGRRMIHWLGTSGLFNTYFAIAVSKEIGDVHGHGLVVDSHGGAVTVNAPPVLLEKPIDYDLLAWDPEPVRSIPFDFSTRPYVTAFSDGADGQRNCRANVPIWTDVAISLNPLALQGGGLFAAITVPVFLTRAPEPSELIGVVAMGLYLRLIDLSPFLLAADCSLFIMDSDTRLISSTDMEKMYYESGVKPDGSPVFTQYTLSTSGVALLQVFAASDGLPGDLYTRVNHQSHFDTIAVPGSGTYWVTLCTLTHYNLRWHLVMLTPERIFLEKIHESSRKNLRTVVGMIVACCVLAVALSVLATDDLKRLAKAFDSLAHMKVHDRVVHRVRKTHILAEYHSLCCGFWQAVDMVANVQAFLPAVEAFADSDVTSSEHSFGRPSLRPSSSFTPPAGSPGIVKRMSVRQMSLGCIDSFCVSLKCHSATCLVVDLAGFLDECRSSCEVAAAAHSEAFALIHDSARRHDGSIVGLSGARSIVTWNIVKQSAPATSAQRALSVVFDLKQHTMTHRLSFGLHHGLTFHGILGSKTQRYTTVGADLVDIAAYLAHYAGYLRVEPAVLASSPVVLSGRGFYTFCKVDEWRLPWGDDVTAYWIEGPAMVNDAEWMYQLQSENDSKPLFLDDYFAAAGEGNAAKAGRALDVFSEEHPQFRLLVCCLRRRLNPHMSGVFSFEKMALTRSLPSLDNLNRQTDACLLQGCSSRNRL
ncbi:hypothetical protein DIPPA_16117 [Diplonema papillatum]|nr:hypothetical protein DIPPA_16117 [Diplonema papillatum]